MQAHVAQNNRDHESCEEITRQRKVKQGYKVQKMARHRDIDLDSDFEYSSEKKRKTWRDDPLATQRPPGSAHSVSVPSKQLLTQERDKEEWRTRRFHLLAMDAYSRHKALVNQYFLSTGRGIESFQRSTETDRNDYSVLKEQHKFLWDSQDEADTWEKKLAKTYYDRLFKEYAISDLSRYKENKVALRWRIEKEVVEGKGQFSCGNKTCLQREGLESWEVNFSYLEQEEKKNALVKLRLCSSCSKKLNYHHKRKLWKSSELSKSSEKKTRTKHKHKKDKKHKHSRKRRHSESKHEHQESSSDNDSGDNLEIIKNESSQGTSSSSGGSIWQKPAESFLEKSKEEEFDDYFKDMLV